MKHKEMYCNEIEQNQILCSVHLFSTPEPKAQGEFLLSPNVCRAYKTKTELKRNRTKRKELELKEIEQNQIHVLCSVHLFISPEPKAHDELLPSPNVHHASSLVCRQQLLQTTSSLKLLGLGP